MDTSDNDAVVPVIREEAHADAVPVQTGGVRVTKRVHARDEVIEQELRRGYADVKRVKSGRLVDGPQPLRREGNTTIIPIVTEVLKIEKQFVLTEEIHITQTEQRETVRHNVTLYGESAEIERFEANPEEHR